MTNEQVDKIHSELKDVIKRNGFNLDMPDEDMDGFQISWFISNYEVEQSLSLGSLECLSISLYNLWTNASRKETLWAFLNATLWHLTEDIIAGDEFMVNLLNQRKEIIEKRLSGAKVVPLK